MPFTVHLDVFDGPFDLLLGLIGKHKLDVTEVALAEVTDEFIAHINRMREADPDWDIDVASDFVLVAATLLDLKAARLLPTPALADDEDVALIEARDLLFARLLQYRAYQDLSVWMGERMETAGRAQPRRGGTDPRFADLLPELVLGITPEQFAAIATEALTPKAPPTVGVEHLHRAQVSVAEQWRVVADRVRTQGEASFSALVADADSTLVVVARFLSVLELFRSRSVGLDQPEALGELTVRWTGPVDGPLEPPVASGWDDDAAADSSASNGSELNGSAMNGAASNEQETQ